MESITSPEQLPNIKHMAVELPHSQRGEPFDAGELLTPNKFGSIISSLDYFQQTQRWAAWATWAAKLIILQPQLREQFKKNHVSLEGVQDQITKELAKEEAFQVVMIMDLRADFQSIVSSNVRLPFDEELLNRAGSTMERASGPRAREYMHWLYYTLIAFPHTKGRFQVSEVLQQQFDEQIHRSFVRGNFDGISNFPDLTAKERVIADTLGFERFRMTPEMWEALRKEFEFEVERTGSNLRDILYMASSIKILAAEQATVTEHGLQLVMSKPPLLTVENPPLPETRKF